MTTLSNEFAALVNKLHESPNDPAIKTAVIQHLPKMLALAQDNPMALYHLAHIYPPNSAQYKKTMRESANLGCTNAMLVMCQILAKTDDVGRAAYYLGMIHKSNDSYIKEQAQKLVSEYPQLARTMNEYAKPKSCRPSNIHRFFTRQPEKEVNNEYVEAAVACKV
ncbi:Dot/Icm secretion system substrate [Legionella gratiana]|uniref:Dot/Icm secretion system substrate n=1 Tax=Legionella gratiana TaxID=45066 RepID=A0A378JMQ2_9GAMM|nr:hypothetical protein [Legionella gratiana]KTD13669.1 Dot/Icm secretion system substrate [Legionella gratiana]STX46020.1 Dot/Icm secretion system substrate [Legionella gratiana]